MKRWVGSFGLIAVVLLLPWSDTDSLRDSGAEVPLAEEALGRPADSAPGLGVPFLVTSLLEKMRLRRSLTEGPGGFSEASPFEAAGVPSEPTGVLDVPSWDVIDEGFELGVDAGVFGSLKLVVGMFWGKGETKP